MTDDDKLALLDKTEDEGWRLLDLQVENVARRHCLELIERCRHIRAGLQAEYQASRIAEEVARVNEDLNRHRKSLIGVQLQPASRYQRDDSLNNDH